MKKITFIGAGSLLFTRNLVRDIQTYPALREYEICLMDINKEKLDAIEFSINKLMQAGNYSAKVTATTSREEALQNACAVICTILTDDISVWRKDLEIPKKYGVDYNIGDTRGVAGFFRTFRTAPVIASICHDMERICPDAFLLNYTNPMGMVCKVVQSQTTIPVMGLCHSVQETTQMLADWIGKPISEITYRCAGLNHQAWVLDFKWQGKDAYPLIREAANREENSSKEPVRVDMLNHLGYFVTESSGHNSEYNPWYRKTPEILDRYLAKGLENDGHYGFEIEYYESVQDTWDEKLKEWYSQGDLPLERGKEYAACILNAVIGDGTPFQFYGNVMNRGYIENLPENACVEVPVYASPYGFEPVSVGKLPPQLACLNGINAQCEDMAVEALLTGNRELVYYAAYLDPLTSAVLPLNEIRAMVDELFDFNNQYLPENLQR